MSLFKRTKALEAEIEEFCDRINQGGLAFRSALSFYLTGEIEAFEEKHLMVNQLESQADALRRRIEHTLYADMLIPDARGDVLGLLENMDSVLNQCEGTLWSFATEMPHIPEVFAADYANLGVAVVECVDALVASSRRFFRDARSVSDHLHKVFYYEKEADKIATKLKRAIFSSELDLSRKLQLRDLVRSIDSIANSTEDVADRLAIYAIKRSF